MTDESRRFFILGAAPSLHRSWVADMVAEIMARFPDEIALYKPELGDGRLVSYGLDVAPPGSDRTTVSFRHRPAFTLQPYQRQIVRWLTKPTKRHARKLKAGRPLWRA